jgi:hypothetical protein
VTPAQRRYEAATDLERQRQIARENSRYGRATHKDMQAVHDAEVAYDEATELAGWAVINR